jgi:hypothetical protein
MRKPKPSRVNRCGKRKPTGRQAGAGRRTLRSEKIAALPILNHFIPRLRLQQWLRECLPREDKPVKVPAAKALLVFLRNLLTSREPFCGVGEWAAGYAPDLLGLTLDELEAVSDDGVGRALGCLFGSEQGAFVLAVIRHQTPKLTCWRPRNSEKTESRCSEKGFQLPVLGAERIDFLLELLAFPLRLFEHPLPAPHLVTQFGNLTT